MQSIFRSLNQALKLASILTLLTSCHRNRALTGKWKQKEDSLMILLPDRVSIYASPEPDSNLGGEKLSDTIAVRKGGLNDTTK